MNKKIFSEKIILYSHGFPPLIGGIETFSYEIVKAIRGMGVDINVLAPKFNTENTIFDLEQDFKIIRLPKRSHSSIRNIFFGYIYLLFTLIKYKPKHIIAADPESSTVCGLLSYIHEFQYSIVIHGFNLFYLKGNSFFKKIKKHLFLHECTNAKIIFAVSNNTKKLLIETGTSSTKIHVIPLGINYNKFMTKTNLTNLKRSLKLGENKILLSLSRLTPAKGHDTVIKSLPTIVQMFPDLKYIIVGDGPDRKKLEALVNDLKVNNYVIFTGQISQDKTVEYYDICDIFVLPCRQENAQLQNFNVVFIEANARGKPVIGGNVGGVPDAIINGETGILVNPYNANEFIDAVIKLLSNPLLSKQLGEKGKIRCFSELTWDKIAFNMIETIKN